MKRFLRYLSGLIVASAMFGLASIVLVAQQTPTPPAPNQPIELPEFIVTGKQQVDIPGGAKQAPVRPPLLSTERLDSLNPIEKLPLPQVAPTPLPRYQRGLITWPGYVEASFGAYLTPAIELGYGFNADNYAIDLHGGYESSSGWVDGSEYATWGIDALSTYVAPEQFLFFAGSTTEVDLGVGQRSYRLFADSSAPDRSVFRFDAGVRTDGMHEGLRYVGSAAWSSRSLTTNDKSVSDNGLQGLLDLEQRVSDWDLGGTIDLRLRSFDGNGYPYMMIGGKARSITNTFSVTGAVGLQWATSTREEDRFGARIDVGAAWTSSHDVTISARVGSGLRPLSLNDLLRVNPYTSDSVTIDMPYDVFSAEGALQWHPHPRLDVVGSIAARQTDRDLIWRSVDRGAFIVDYRTTTTIEAIADARYAVTAADLLLANFTMTSSSVSDGEQTPYIAPFKVMVGYERTWSIPLTTTLDLYYVGDRYADVENRVVLSGYLDLRLRASYEIKKDLDVFLRGANLLGSTMELWQGYQERGIFITGGITWKF